MKRLSLSFLLAVLLVNSFAVSTYVVQAQTPPGSGVGNGGAVTPPGSGIGNGGAVTPPGDGVGNPSATKPGGKGLSIALENPLKFKTLEEFIVAILNVIIVIATPIVVIFIILAGFKYVTARGNPGDIEEATRALTYAVIGGVLIIGAVAIAEIIKNLITAFA